jgi:hypothetical protein
VLPAVNDDEIAAKQDAIMTESPPLRDRIVGLDLEMIEAADRQHAGEIDGRNFYRILARLRKDHDWCQRTRENPGRRTVGSGPADMIAPGRWSRDLQDTPNHRQ